LASGISGLLAFASFYLVFITLGTEANHTCRWCSHRLATAARYMNSWLPRLSQN